MSKSIIITNGFRKGIEFEYTTDANGSKAVVLLSDMVFDIGIRDLEFDNELFTITTDGLLVIKKGFVWNGPTGLSWLMNTRLSPCIIDKLIKPTLLHDALYTLLNHRVLQNCNYYNSDVSVSFDTKPSKLFDSMRKKCDQLFYTEMRKNSISWWYAQAIYFIVRRFGKKAAKPCKDNDAYATRLKHKRFCAEYNKSR